jgi:hypothetical protein
LRLLNPEKHMMRRIIVSEVATKKRTPVKRWIILGMVALGIYAAFIGPSILKPLSPTIVLPAEEVGLSISGFQITNTMIATLLTDILVLLMGIGATRFARSGKLVPDGFYNAFETIVEFLWNSVEGTAGKWAKRIFPIPATIFILVFVANMIRLLPGFEAIGGIKESHKEGYAPVALFNIGSVTIYTHDNTQPVVHGEQRASKPLLLVNHAKRAISCPGYVAHLLILTSHLLWRSLLLSLRRFMVSGPWDCHIWRSSSNSGN